MTETPRDMDDVPAEEHLDSADLQERLDTDPETEANAPNREPTTEKVGPDEDSETRSE